MTLAGHVHDVTCTMSRARCRKPPTTETAMKIDRGIMFNEDDNHNRRRRHEKVH